MLTSWGLYHDGVRIDRFFAPPDKSESAILEELRSQTRYEGHTYLLRDVERLGWVKRLILIVGAAVWRV